MQNLTNTRQNVSHSTIDRNNIDNSLNAFVNKSAIFFLRLNGKICNVMKFAPYAQYYLTIAPSNLNELVYIEVL